LDDARNAEWFAQQQLALRAAWMREHPGKRVVDWKRLGEKGRDNYRNERLKRRRVEMDAAWLVDHGEPMPHYCGMDDQEGKQWDELFKRTPDFTDQHFDLAAEKVNS
jgi:hypothetical protein